VRIAIVSDKAPVMNFLQRAVMGLEDHEVAWIALNGAAAVERCRADTPDLILMDLIMPVMDGVEATRRIMERSPCPVLVVTPTLEGNTGRVFEAMGHGALDAVHVPETGGGLDAGREMDLLVKKIAMIEKLKGQASPGQVRGGLPPAFDNGLTTLIVMGSSTGGPKALAEILSGLPAELGAGIVIVQHVDSRFSSNLAVWLNGQTGLEVRLASTGDRPEQGKVFLGGSSNHLVLTRNLTLSYTPEPENIPFRPSVDVFFKSVAKNWPSEGIAVLLTGMGRDGAEGLMALKRAGWYTMAQNEETSVIYGMPKAARALGAASEILAVGEVAPTIRRSLNRGKARTKALSWEW